MLGGADLMMIQRSKGRRHDRGLPRCSLPAIELRDHTSALAGCFGAMFCATTFCATTHAADAIAHEMKNAVHGSRVLGAATIAGPQTRSVNRLIMAASVIAATRGKIENSTPRPQAICPAPVRVAQPTR